MKTPPDVFGEASLYLRIYFAGVTGLLLYNMGSGVLRAVGDTKRPLYFLVLTSVLNIILDLIFVLQFHMGIAGVAMQPFLPNSFRPRRPWRSLSVRMTSTVSVLGTSALIGAFLRKFSV